MATHPCVCLPGELHGQRSPWDRRVGRDWATNKHTHPQRSFRFTENWAPIKTGSHNSSLLPSWGTLCNSWANADVWTKAFGLINFLSFPVLQIFSLFTGARLNLRDSVGFIFFLHGVKNYFYCFAREGGGHSRLMPSKLCVPTWRRLWEVL